MTKQRTLSKVFGGHLFGTLVGQFSNS